MTDRPGMLADARARGPMHGALPIDRVEADDRAALRRIALAAAEVASTCRWCTAEEAEQRGYTVGPGHRLMSALRDAGYPLIPSAERDL